MMLSIDEVKEIQRGVSGQPGLDWTGKPLLVDGGYGPKTRWWHGITMLPAKRQQIVRAMLSHNGKAEDKGRPNRSTWIDSIQSPGGIGLGNPWCIALISHYLRECGLDWPYHMSAYALINWAKIEGKVTESPLPGDVYAFLYDPTAKGFTPGHGGGGLAINADWACVLDGNVGDSVKVGKRARNGLVWIRTVDPEDPPLIMPPLDVLPNLDGSLRGTR